MKSRLQHSKKGERNKNPSFSSQNVQAKSFAPPDSGIHFTIQKKESKNEPYQLMRGPQKNSKKKKKGNKHKIPKGHQITKLKVVRRNRASSERYPGHDSMANKRALLEIAKHRHHQNIQLSHPEATAVRNSPDPKWPTTGYGNKTQRMEMGTAICHKISDKSIRSRIDLLYEAETKSKDEGALDEFLLYLIKYIDPSHIGSDDAPKGGYYEAQVKAKYGMANDAFTLSSALKAGNPKRAICAHIVGAAVANSPVNLFLGDSKTNSAIGAHFDQNTFTKPPLARQVTPRSERAEAEMERDKNWKDQFGPRETEADEPMRSSEV
jgi:hypothetical protein